MLCRPRAELAILPESFAAVSKGVAAAVCVHGPSGIGKTALVQQFLDQVPGDEAVVLRGRCYEHESVPYKALDGVMDSLSQYLGRLPRTEVATLVPPDALALSRLFPVMLHVEAVTTLPRLEPNSGSARPAAPRIFVVARAADPNGASPAAGPLHRRSALGGCGQRAPAEELLGRQSRHRSCGRLLPHGRNRVQAVSSTLLERAGSNSYKTLPLDPMTEDEARALIASLIPVDSPVSQAGKLEIVREAGGSPFFSWTRWRVRWSSTTPARSAGHIVEMIQGA